MILPLSLSLSLYHFISRKQNLLRDKKLHATGGQQVREPKWATPSHTVSKTWVSELLRSINDKQEIKIQGRERMKVWDFNTGLIM